MVGDDWDHPDSNYLNPTEWLDKSPYQLIQGIFKGLIERAFDRCQNYITQKLHTYLQIYWENQQINLEAFQSDRIVHLQESFYYTFLTLLSQKQRFEKEFPNFVDIGMIRIDAQNLRQQIVSSPQLILQEFYKFLPKRLKAQNDELQEWMSQTIGLLKNKAPNIDEFVKKKNELIRVQREVAYYRKRVRNIQTVLTIWDEFKLDFDKDIRNEIMNTLALQKRLDVNIVATEEMADHNLERYCKDFNAVLIPQLEMTSQTIDLQIQDKKFFSLELDVGAAIAELTLIEGEFRALEEKAVLYCHYEASLGMQKSEFEYINNMKLDLSLKLSMWRSLQE